MFPRNTSGLISPDQCYCYCKISVTIVSIIARVNRYTFHASINPIRKGYVPGEQITFDLHITNKSGQELTKWEIRLLQVRTWKRGETTKEPGNL